MELGWGMINWSLWFLFPVGIAVATLAISAGISASNFTVPMFVLVLDLPPKVAFWIALLSMTFGFGSGAIRNYRARTIEWSLVGRYVVWAVPAGVVGAVLSGYLPQFLLLAGFGIFLFCYAVYRLVTLVRIQSDSETQQHEIVYTKSAIAAGFLHGLIATGMGKFMVAVCINHQKCRHHSSAVGTAVVTVLAVNTCTFVARMNTDLFYALIQNLETVVSIVVWMIPGVIVGGQIGPRISARLSKYHLQVYITVLLFIVAILVFIRGYSVVVR